jgi:peptide chain release factor 1
MVYDKNLFGSLEKIKEKYIELTKSRDSESTSPKEYIEINKQIKKFEAIVEEFDKYSKLLDTARQAEELASGSDELAEMAKLELVDAHEQIPKYEEKLKIMLLPQDPNNDKNIIVEMRPAAGGDEATIFVGDLYECYKLYCEEQG